MEDHDVAGVVATLREQAELLEASLREVQANEAELRSKLDRIQLSLAALNGEPLPRRAGGKRENGGRGGLGDAGALAVVRQSLQGGRPKTFEALKAELLEHARSRGLSGTGAHLVLRRILNSGEFSEGADGWEMVA